MPPDWPVTARMRPALDSGPEPASTLPRGGSSSFRPKGLGRHVLELTSLADGDLCALVDESRAAVDLRLHLARLEVELNVWTFTATNQPRR